MDHLDEVALLALKGAPGGGAVAGYARQPRTGAIAISMPARLAIAGWVIDSGANTKAGLRCKMRL